MLNGYNYIVITEDHNEEVITFKTKVNRPHRYYASVIRTAQCNNLLSVLASYPNAIHANICSTKKEAEELARTWNEAYIENGTYLFEAPKVYNVRKNY